MIKKTFVVSRFPLRFIYRRFIIGIIVRERQKTKKYISTSLTDCSEDGRGKENRLRVRPVSRSHSSLQRHSIGNGFLRFT